MQAATRGAGVMPGMVPNVIPGGVGLGNPGLPALPRVAPAGERRGLAPSSAGLSAAQERLVLEHLPVVRHVARQVHEKLPQHIELDELIGAGTLGLVDAARKYDESKNVQFRSYAQFRVRGAILDSLRSLDWGPRELRRKGRAMEEATRALQARLGRPPQDAEVAAEMGIALLQLQQLAGEIKGLDIAALNADRGDEGGEEELAFVPAKESENPLFQCLDREARRRLIGAIDELGERERAVMRLYYFEEMTMREIGGVLGVVESRVSQIHSLALRRLRGLLADLRGGAPRQMRRAS